MNKVLMTGLAVGTDAGVCSSCNYDFEWLFRYPSIFLWTDKILITKTIHDMINKAQIPAINAPALSKSLKLIFELAESHDLIEVVDPTKVVTPEVQNAIWEEVSTDRKLLSEYFPQDVLVNEEENPKVPMEMFINNFYYCSPFIATIYATLALTRAWKANCLFNEMVLNYLGYKFGISGIPHQSEPGKADAFRTVFNAYLPNTTFLPEYVSRSYQSVAQCGDCVREQTCKDGYLVELENNFTKFLTWRNYDEILQLREVVDKIVSKRSKISGIIDPEEILQEFQSVEMKYRRRIKKVFPKIKRWANIGTMVSASIAFLGLAVNQPLVTIPGGVLITASVLSKELIDYLTSKMSWVSFIAKEEEIRTLKTG
jgi:hypothetical protein